MARLALLLCGLAAGAALASEDGDWATGRKRSGGQLEAGEGTAGFPSMGGSSAMGSMTSMAKKGAASAKGKAMASAKSMASASSLMDNLPDSASDSMRGMVEKAKRTMEWEASSLRPDPPAWKPLEPTRESNENGDYSLSGGIYHSFDREHCYELYLKFGKCLTPCARYIGDGVPPALFPGNGKMTKAEEKRSKELHGKWSEKDVEEHAKKIQEYQAAVEGQEGSGSGSGSGNFGRAEAVVPLQADPAFTGMDCLVKRVGMDPGAEDDCMCVDPCRRYKTCEECTANKASHTEPPPGADPTSWRPPPWAAVGSPYNCGWCQNKCVTGNRMGPSIGGDSCLVWQYKVPQCQPYSPVNAPVGAGADPCAGKHYSECDPPCQWIGWTRFTGYCSMDSTGGGSGAAPAEVAEENPAESL